MPRQVAAAGHTQIYPVESTLGWFAKRNSTGQARTFCLRDPPSQLAMARQACGGKNSQSLQASLCELRPDKSLIRDAEFTEDVFLFVTFFLTTKTLSSQRWVFSFPFLLMLQRRTRRSEREKQQPFGLNIECAYIRFEHSKYLPKADCSFMFAVGHPL